MNDCEKYMELMSQMLDGELPAEQAEALRTHIETCPECRRVYGAFQNVSEALSGELAEPPEMLSKGVMFKIRNQKKHRRFAYGKFTALAACLALILLGAAKYGLFGGGITSTSLDSTAAGNKTASAADTAGTAESGAGAVEQGKQLSPDELKKGVKLKQTDDGTVYQLGFPVQNVQLLEGAAPEAVKKEPARLLNAKKLDIYLGSWRADAELAAKNGNKSGDKSETKNERITTVTDAETLGALGKLLIAVPDDTTKLTVDSKQFTDGTPVCTLYIPAQRQTETAKPKESPALDAAESSPAVSDGSDDKAEGNAFRGALANMRSSLLSKSDTAKESPSASPDVSSEAGKSRAAARDLTISVYYVDGEIWCVAQYADDGTPADTETQSGAPDSAETDTPDKAAASTESAQPSPTNTVGISAAPENSAAADDNCVLHVGRILYKASGTPEKLDDLLEKLEAAGGALLTENTQKKAS